MKKYLLIVMTFLTAILFSCKTQKNENTAISIAVEKYNLPNGLTVVLHEDKANPIVSVAVYYHVGSSRETEGKTGFAHLFEHMMFEESENLPRGRFVENISNAGGTFNGNTTQDRTIYFETLPKNYLEMALWMESDRMGYLENTVTRTSLANQQNVVQNEKRQSYDNTPYGFTQTVINRNLYPKGHPYNWDVIGDMKDLTNATVEDVKGFHRKYYSPVNAFLAISGDFDKPATKAMVEKYFGEIKSGETIEKRKPMPVGLASTVRLYHQDNFAKAPQLTMTFPSVERYSKDSYALNFLGDLLANSKKSPLYTILVKDRKLTSRVMARNGSQELAGSFTISVTANPGVNLTEVEKAIFDGFKKFEKEGFTAEDLSRIKAGSETRFYNSFSSVQGKAFAFAEYTMYTGDPEFYKKDLDNIQSVSMADIKSVYNKYIRNKNFVETSFVPKGDTCLVAKGSVNAGIVEENVAKAAEVKAEAVAPEVIAKTPAKFDRSVMPNPGPNPEVNIPVPWTSSLSNGMKIWGITQGEMPLVQYSILIDGGHFLDNVSKPGVANMVASIMNEGTKNKTSEQLEDAIGLLGATIRVSASNENISVDVSSLSRNFEKTIALVEEMLLEPRWDTMQFGIVKLRILNNLKRNLSNPDYLASSTLNKLMFGDNILATDISGTESSVASITIDDLKDFYNRNFSPSIAKFIIAGDVDKPRVEAALASLSQKWLAKDVKMHEVKIPDAPLKSQVYFVDVPDAKQSAITIGAPSLRRTDPDFFPSVTANYKLGAREASISGIWMQIIREQKGFTYGAYSSFSGFKNYGYFSVSSRVRTNSTLESMMIFRNEMEKYRKDMPQEYIDFTRSGMMKSDARRFETLGNLLDYLSILSTYSLPADYVNQEESYLKSLTVEKQLEIVKKYIDPSRMYYVVAGDAATQLKDLEKLGLGKPILVKN
ncbi:MAG: pitrilysin family protein [Bacteroidales bacterium]